MELDIYFKNVGQGDTIFLHWDGGRKTGLIDCNLYQGTIRQTIRHIELKEVKEFEFVLMSHPHSDHFSGFPKLFDYCEKNNIIIKKFLHTAAFDPVCLREMMSEPLDKKAHYDVATSTVNRDKHKKLLWSLFAKLHEQHVKRPDGFIKAVHAIGNDYQVTLDNFIQMRFLAPFAYDEVKQYISKGYSLTSQELLEIKEKHENNPYANYLSSFIQICSESEHWQVLLCSDITQYTLNRIRSNDIEFSKIRDHILKAIQIPHHGSSHNHHPEFWKDIPGVDTSNVIISVGKGYGHPNRSVVKFFKDLTGSLHTTNYVGGYKEFCEDKVEEMDLLHAVTDLPGFMSSQLAAADENLSDTRCCEKHLKIWYGDIKPECKVLDV